MPRSVWNGSLTVGLLTVPVKVHSATQDRAVHFHEVHVTDGAPVEHRRFCSVEGVEVPFAEVVRGAEVAPDEHVVLSAEEVKAAGGRRSRRIDLEEFVPAADVDPVFLDKAYHLGTREGGEDAYRLLHAALERTGRLGLGRWVFHDRERLVGVRARGPVLAMHTLRAADEVVAPRTLDRPAPAQAPGERELDMAAMLVQGLHADWEPERLEDTYRERLLELVRAKAEGREVAPAPAASPEASDDLLAALQASLAAVR